MIKWWDSLTSRCKSGPHKFLRELWKPAHFPVNRPSLEAYNHKTALTRVTGSPWERVMLSQGANANAKTFTRDGKGFQSSRYLRTLGVSLNYDQIQLDRLIFCNHNIWSFKKTCLCCVWHCSDLRLKLNPFKELLPQCLISGNFDPNCCRSYSYNRWAVSGSMLFRCVALRYSKSCS